MLGRLNIKKAIKKGLANGNLKDELAPFRDISISSHRDAEAICWGLSNLYKMNLAPDELGLQVYELAGLFQQVDSVDCDPTLTKHRHMTHRVFNDINGLGGSAPQKPST